MFFQAFGRETGKVTFVAVHLDAANALVLVQVGLGHGAVIAL